MTLYFIKQMSYNKKSMWNKDKTTWCNPKKYANSLNNKTAFLYWLRLFGWNSFHFQMYDILEPKKSISKSIWNLRKIMSLPHRIQTGIAMDFS